MHKDFFCFKLLFLFLCVKLFYHPIQCINHPLFSDIALTIIFVSKPCCRMNNNLLLTKWTQYTDVALFTAIEKSEVVKLIECNFIVHNMTQSLLDSMKVIANWCGSHW